MRVFVQNGDSGRAMTSLQHGFRNAAKYVSRHLMFKTVAPYFWIEPTSVLDIDDSDFPAVINGYGPRAYVGSDVVHPMLENPEVMSTSSVQSTICVRWRSARTVPLLQHLSGHVADGLACIRIVQADTNKILLLGGTAREVSQRIYGKEGLHNYMWTRGQSGVIHPAECTYVGGDIALRFIHMMPASDDDYSDKVTHIPMVEELLNAKITFRCTKLQVVPNGKSNMWPVDVKRSRSRAAQMLRTVNSGAKRILLDGHIPESLTAPKRAHPIDPIHSHSGKSMLASIEKAEPLKTELSSGTSHSSASERIERGETKQSVVHQVPMNGPGIGGAVRATTVTLPSVTDTDSGGTGGGNIIVPDAQ